MGNMQFNRQTIINAIANKSIVWITGGSSALIPANTYYRTSIYSPQGTISRLYNGRFIWNGEGDATLTGGKDFIVDVQTQPGVGTGGIGMFKFHANANSVISYDQGFLQAGSNYYPSDQNALNFQIANTFFDDLRAVQMVQFNGQNKDSSAPRSWDLFVEREVVSR
jgi:hypothetical protein